MRKRAFTLIELLVVIAIIAILAAILFPVFAQAKQSAKRTASLSNMRQVSLASQLYMGDYDNLTPPLFYIDVNNRSYPSTQGVYYYPILLLSYTKNEQIFICPNDTATDPILVDPQGKGRFDKSGIFYYYFLGANPSYGFNYRFLNREFVEFQFGRTVASYGGLDTTSLESPAQTVMFGEATMKDLTSRGFMGAPSGLVTGAVGYSRIEPPAPVTRDSRLPPYNGWSGTFPDARSQGQLWGRFNKEQVVIGWVDGHTKVAPIRSLVGTGTTPEELNRFWNGRGG